MTTRVKGPMLSDTLVRSTDLQVNSLLYLDIANNRVGINSIEPMAALHVNGSIISDSVEVTAGEIHSTLNNLVLHAPSNLSVVIDAAALALPAGEDTARPTPAANGMIRFNTTNGTVETYNNGWHALSVGVDHVYDKIVATNHTTYTVTSIDGMTAEQLLVTINGVAQTPHASYTVNSNTITFAEPVTVGDVIELRGVRATYNTPGIIVPDEPY